ncbi:MAG: isopenicillin N synthase family oxygenase [Alphaproteobacteria bacterium]|nr:isopenicillin N synthase family oxygenase [Alphaproteobacteria bacterium]
MSLEARDPPAFAARLGASFSRYGFATVSAHGIDQGLIEDAQARTKVFFALPEEMKRRYLVPGGAGQRGYTPFGIETAKGAAQADLKEFWHTGRELPAGHRLTALMPPNLWPSEVPGFRESVYGLYEALDALGLRILRGIARHLNLPAGFFDDSVHLGNSVLRLLHYPPVIAPTRQVRAGAHEDINAITVLLGAEEAGLEVQERDGSWLPINPPPGSAVVNIGDMLERHTNGVLPSTSHRVVNPPAERARCARYSTPFFLHYRPDFLIETIPSCVTADNRNHYPEPITANAFLLQRLAEIKLT